MRYHAIYRETYGIPPQILFNNYAIPPEVIQEAIARSENEGSLFKIRDNAGYGGLKAIEAKSSDWKKLEQELSSGQ